MKSSQHPNFESCFDKDLSSQQSGGFWKKVIEEDEIRSILALPEIHSGQLYRNKAEPDRLNFFVLKQGLLYYHPINEPHRILGIAKLSFYHLKTYQSQSYGKPMYGLKLFSSRDQTKLISNSLEAVFEWHRHLASQMVNMDFFSRFDMRELIGEGGFSQVYKVVERKTGKAFAAKIIKHKMIFSDRRGVLLMKQEIEIMRQLNHPNIVKLCEVHEIHNAVILLLEYAEGQELKKITFGLSFKDIMTIVRSLLSVVAYLESLNIIHRDLKPTNVMIVNPEKIGFLSTKVLDFGLAAFLNEKLLLTRCGTPGYIAPEVLTQAPHSKNVTVLPSVDVYSVGIIMYEMIFKINPFKDGLKQQDSKKVVVRNSQGIIDYTKPCIYKNELDEKSKELLRLMLEPIGRNRQLASQLMKLEIVELGLTSSKRSDYAPCLEENAISQLSVTNYLFKVNKNRFKQDEKMANRKRPPGLILEVLTPATLPEIEEVSPLEKNVLSPLNDTKKYRRREEDSAYELFITEKENLDKRFKGRRDLTPLTKPPEIEEKDTSMVSHSHSRTNQRAVSSAGKIQIRKSLNSGAGKNMTVVEDVHNYKGLFVLHQCKNPGNQEAESQRP